MEVRVVLGPHENVARLFLVDKLSTPEISSDVAQFLNLSLAECHGILQRYHYEEERQILLLKEKYDFSKFYINFTFKFSFQIFKLYYIVFILKILIIYIFILIDNIYIYIYIYYQLDSEKLIKEKYIKLYFFLF